MSDALGVIRGHDWGPDGLPAITVPKIRVEGKGGMSSALATEIDWSRAIITREKELERLDSYAAVARAMRSDPTVAGHLDLMVGDGGWMARVDIDSCLRSFLHHLLMRQNDLSIEATKFGELYDEFEGYFYSDSLKRRAVSPLNNFEMETDRVELEPGLSLRRLSLQEREEIASRWMSFMPFPMPFIAGWPTGREEFALDLFAEVPKVIGDRPPGVAPVGFHQIASERLETVVVALRLFRAGAVDLTSISVMSIGWNVHGGGGSTTRHRSPLLRPNYTLPKAEIPLFVRFWADFQRQRSKKRSRVELALRRFNLAYERLLPEDRLIDCVIALEALLLRAEEQQELAFRMALRGSRLLGRDPDARSDLFSRFRSAYRVRSEIVHGGSVPTEVVIGSTRLPFNQFVDAVADDVRCSIRKMLELTETAGETQVIAALDEKAIRGA